jgi:hypothetical protein
MKIGRPLKFKTAKQLEDAGLAYFVQCQAGGIPLTITGLALALNTTRQTLLEYEGEVEGRVKADPAFADAVKRLKTTVENYAEQAMFLNKNAAGPIFALKNFGWKDRQEVTGADGEPLNMSVNVSGKTADELLELLTAKGANSTRGRRGPGQTSRLN